jgi:putative transposase
MNEKRFRRLYREEDLQGKEAWWPQADARGACALAVVDDCTRECLALVADTSLSGARVARELHAIIAVRGKPMTCVSDNGTELTGMAILAWSKGNRRRLALRPGGQSATERVRREIQRPAPGRVPEQAAFSSLAEARAALAAWRDDYNRVRLHSALANRAPE